MSFLDIFILVSLVIGFMIGWKLKIINIIGMIVSLIVGIWIANTFLPRLIGFYPDMIATPTSKILTWFCLFIAIVMIIFLFTHIITKMFELIHFQWLDHILGAVFIIITTMGLLVIMLGMLDNLAQIYHWQVTKNSTLTPLLLKKAHPLIEKAVQKFPPLQQLFP